MQKSEGFTVSFESLEVLRTSLTSEGKGINTLKAYTTDAKVFIRWVLDKHYGHLEMTRWEFENLVYESTKDEVEALAAEWLNEERCDPGIKAKTVLRHLAGVRRYLQANGIAAPLVKYKGPSVADPEPHPMEGGIDTIRKMIKAADGHVEKEVMLALLGYMAFRMSEARSIRPNHVDIYKRDLLIRGKGDSWIRVPIPKEAFPIIWRAREDAIRDGKEFLIGAADKTARTWYSELAKEVLGRKLDPDGREGSHAARHAVITDVYNETKDLVLASRVARHRDPRTTAGYIGDDREEMRNVLDNRGKNGTS